MYLYMFVIRVPLSIRITLETLSQYQPTLWSCCMVQFQHLRPLQWLIRHLTHVANITNTSLYYLPHQSMLHKTTPYLTINLSPSHQLDETNPTAMCFTPIYTVTQFNATYLKTAQNHTTLHKTCAIYLNQCKAHAGSLRALIVYLHTKGRISHIVGIVFNSMFLVLKYMLVLDWGVFSADGGWLNNISFTYWYRWIALLESM